MLSTPLLVALSLPAASYAYSWAFQGSPQQCSNLTINISGSDGQPPYRVLILPVGASPLANNIEARKIIDMPFPGTSTSVSFQLQYPANSQFVAVVSDAKNFGSGGTSVAAQVTSSGDSSCFSSTTNVQPDFVFSIDPPNQVVQCVQSRIWWDPSTVQGTPNFVGVIPGGESFQINNNNNITQVPSEGTGFAWTPSLRGGTTVIVVGGDNRGNGTGGSTFNIVSSGINNDGSCLSNTSPSSTPGSPAGGSYPTSSNGSGVGNIGRGGSKTNIGAIVGGVIGGLVLLIALCLLLLFFRRRKQVHTKQKERPVDLLNADDEGDETHRPSQLPQYYEPEPFMVPDPTVTSGGAGTRASYETSSDGRPLSGLTSGGLTSASRSGTPDMSTTSAGQTRKGALRQQMRPVNIIQHDDAGPSEAPKVEEAEAETIELPPAYTNIRKPGKTEVTTAPPNTITTAAPPV